MAKVAVVPEIVVLDKLVPFFISVTPLIPLVGPEPEAVKVSPVIETGVPLGLVNTTCNTATLVAPGSWLELGGGAGPWAACTVTWVAVGVIVVVFVGVFVGVLVGLFIGVLVAVLVTTGLLVGVLVDVLVSEFVGVSVGVFVGLLVGVLV